MIQKPYLLLGAHMSIAGGFYKAIERGKHINCTCIQIFTKSNRQWKAKPITQDDITFFQDALKTTPTIKDIVVHASYLINIGSPKKEIEKKSIASLQDELIRCEQLEIPFLVFHPGSCLANSEKECLERITQNINTILENTPGKTILLIENTAGQGSVVGYSFEQLAYIYQGIQQKERVGFCIDTCHAFAAGYDFRTEKSYGAVWQEFDALIGLDKIKVLHINDSLKDLGSHIDRHTHIGQGKIGLEGFSLLFNDPRFFHIPKVLETPKENDLQEDIQNMNTIKQLLNNETKTTLQVLK